MNDQKHTHTDNNHTALVNVTSATGILNVSPRELRRLVKAGQLKDRQPRVQGARHHARFALADIQTLAAKRAEEARALLPLEPQPAVVTLRDLLGKLQRIEAVQLKIAAVLGLDL
jgi:hypothetical protein